MCDRNLQDHIRRAFPDEDLDIQPVRRTAAKEGFIGNITFIKATGTHRTLNLVIKAPKELDKVREQKAAFLKETYVYDKVKPAFDEFLQEKGAPRSLVFFPECYHTEEVIVLEDLKARGFDLWDKSLPLGSQHAASVLEALAVWHSTSFALKAQKPEVFTELTRDYGNTLSRIAVAGKCDFTMWLELDSVRKMVFPGEFGDHFRFTRDDFKYAFTDLFLEDPDYHVVLHGDCWNNNFLFKLGAEDGVRIIDWQCSSLGSPIFDLSHFIYTCTDTKECPDVEKLLKMYHERFAENLARLGCDSQAFPFRKLRDHWNRFSRFGLFFSLLVVKLSVVGKRGWDAYLERARSNLLHYHRNLGTNAET